VAYVTVEGWLKQKSLQLMPSESMDDADTTLSGSAFQILVVAQQLSYQ